MLYKVLRLFTLENANPAVLWQTLLLLSSSSSSSSSYGLIYSC